MMVSFSSQDERLGYIFNDYADVDWDHHLPRMVDFWLNLLFQTSRYNGRPFRHHLPLPIQKGDFVRWLSLFKETVDEHFEGEIADFAKEMASKIASSFSIRLEMKGKYKYPYPIFIKYTINTLLTGSFFLLVFAGLAISHLQNQDQNIETKQDAVVEKTQSLELPTIMRMLIIDMHTINEGIYTQNFDLIEQGGSQH